MDPYRLVFKKATLTCPICNHCFLGYELKEKVKSSPSKRKFIEDFIVTEDTLGSNSKLLLRKRLHLCPKCNFVMDPPSLIEEYIRHFPELKLKEKIKNFIFSPGYKKELPQAIKNNDLLLKIVLHGKIIEKCIFWLKKREHSFYYKLAVLCKSASLLSKEDNNQALSEDFMKRAVYWYRRLIISYPPKHRKALSKPHYFSIAELYRRLGEFNKSKKIFSYLLRTADSQSRPLYRQQLQLIKERNSKATLYPVTPSILTEDIFCYLKMRNQLKKAEFLAKGIVLEFPKRVVSVYSSLAEAYLKNKKIKKAYYFYQKADYPCWLAEDFGGYFKKRKQLSKAFREYERAAKGYIRMKINLFSVRQLYFRIGSYYSGRDNQKARDYLNLYLKAKKIDFDKKDELYQEKAREYLEKIKE